MKTRFDRDKRQIACYQVPEIAIVISIAKYIAQRIEEIISGSGKVHLWNFKTLLTFLHL